MAEWQRRFWSTAASGYIGFVTRMLLGLLLFRMMFQKFSGEEFGFWAMLWSLFGYGILLDFGFGFTAQKAVAGKTATGDMAGLSRLLATIFWTFVGMAAVLLLFFILIREPMLARMGVDAANHAEFSKAYIVFFIGLAVTFPLGLFPEILRGLQRVDIANWMGVLSTTINFGFLYWGLTAGWGFPILMGISVATTALPNLVAAILAMRRLPGVSLAPKHFEWRAVRAQMGFSLTAYLVTFSNLLMAKSDQLVISLALGVALVAIYQAGYKMAEMLGLLSTQLQQSLSPAAAAMFAAGDSAGLKKLLLSSSRLTFFLVTPCYLLSAAYLENLIRLLTGLESVPAATWWTGQVLLFAIFSSQLTNGCAKRVLMMCGEERRLLFISVTEAVANVALSIILALRYGVVGVALGTMIPAVLVGWFWVLPLTIAKLEIPWRSYLLGQLRGTALPLLVFIAVLAGLFFAVPIAADGGLIALGWRGAACMLPLLVLGRRVLIDMAKG